MHTCVRAHAHTHIGRLCEKDSGSGEGEEGDEESDTKRVQHEPASRWIFVGAGSYDNR